MKTKTRVRWNDKDRNKVFTAAFLLLTKFGKPANQVQLLSDAQKILPKQKRRSIWAGEASALLKQANEWLAETESAGFRLSQYKI